MAKPIVHGFKVTQQHWDKIFDPATRPPEEAKPLTVDCHVNAPAIHDDKLYKGYDWGAGRNFDGRTERREWMKKNNVECKG